MLHWVLCFLMSCPSGQAWKVENLCRRREVLSKIPSPSRGEGSICYLNEPLKRKSLQISTIAGPNGFSILCRLIYLSPYSGLSPSLKLVSWALVLEPSSHSFPHRQIMQNINQNNARLTRKDVLQLHHLAIWQGKFNTC